QLLSLEAARKIPGRLRPLALVLVEEAIEGGLEAEPLAIDVESERGHGLAEQPVHVAAPVHPLFMEQLLYSVLELIGLLFAQVLEPRPVVPKLRVGHGRFQHLVVEPVPLETEEQQLG